MAEGAKTRPVVILENGHRWKGLLVMIPARSNVDSVLSDFREVVRTLQKDGRSIDLESWFEQKGYGPIEIEIAKA